MFSKFFKKVFGKKNTDTDQTVTTSTSSHDQSEYQKFRMERTGRYRITKMNIVSKDLEIHVPDLFCRYEEELVDFARKCESSFSYIAASHVSEKITRPTLKAFYEAIKREKLYIVPPFDKIRKEETYKFIDEFLERILDIKYNKVNDRLDEGGYRKKDML